MWLENIYYWFWHDLLGLDKSISDLARELQKQYPLVIMLIFLVGGILIGISKKRWWLLLVFGLGILVGHLWF
jgi:hypothetical protein